jgi:hypothetical protein
MTTNELQNQTPYPAPRVIVPMIGNANDPGISLITDPMKPRSAPILTATFTLNLVESNPVDIAATYAEPNNVGKKATPVISSLMNTYGR